MSENRLPQWDLSPIFSSPQGEDFKAALRSVDTLCQSIRDSLAAGEALAAVLPQYNRLLATYETLSAYADCLVSTDTSSELYNRVQGQVEDKDVAVTEIESLMLERIGRSRDELDDPRLSDYRYVLSHMAIDAGHRMSLHEEVLASDLRRSGEGAFERLFDTVTSSLEENGRTLTQLRSDASDPDRAVRRDAYLREKKILTRAQDVLAACLNSVKGTCLTLERRQGWKSPLEHSAFISRISMDSLNALLAALDESMPLFREYFRIKARLLGLDQLAWYDIFAPVRTGGAGHRKYGFEDAHDLIVKSFSAFSPEMGDFADRAFRNRWIDAEPHAGKVGGAYDTAFPLAGESRVFTNFSFDYQSVSTIAHELGHAYHDSIVLPLPSLLYSYPMTLAETASIFSEQILFQEVLKTCDEEEAAGYIEGFVGDAAQVCVDILSRFRFEDALFRRRSEGEVSASGMSQLMAEAQESTYADAVSDKHELMWAVKGHYYSADFSYYNYPYAFGQLFALALFSRSSSDPDFSRKYRSLLSMTGRASCEEVAAMAGADITSVDFWREGLSVIGGYIGRLKRFADKM